MQDIFIHAMKGKVLFQILAL